MRYTNRHFTYLLTYTSSSINRRTGASLTSISLLHCCSTRRTSCPSSAYWSLNAISVGTSGSVTPVSRDVWICTGRQTVVLLRYVKYCFRSINDAINKKYRDNDTICTPSESGWHDDDDYEITTCVLVVSVSR